MSDIDKISDAEKVRLRDMVIAVSGTGLKPGPGHIVETAHGLVGRTYHRDAPVNGKQVVYVEGKKLLCDPAKLVVRGFID